MMSKTGNRKGFTLVEIMVSTCLLAIGIVFIYRAYFSSLDAFNYSVHYLAVAPMANERIAEAESNLRLFDSLGNSLSQGTYLLGGKQFKWGLTSTLVEKTATSKLYAVKLQVTWQEAKSSVELTRSTYAWYKKK